MIEAHLPVLQVILPLLSAPIVMLLRPLRLAWGATLAASLAAFGLAVLQLQALGAESPLRYAVGGWPAPFGIELVVGPLQCLVLLLITGSSSAALLIGGPGLLRQLPAQRGSLFFAAWLMAFAGLSGIAVSGDAFNVFVFMEVSSLASYVLIAAGEDRRALPAVFKYLVIGTVGATFYLIGVGMLYMMTGTLNFDDLASRLDSVSGTSPVLLAAGFVTVGLALKAAIFPLHVWLPSAYTFAPNAVTAFLAACSTKVAVYVLFRFDFLVFRPNLPLHSQQFEVVLTPLLVAGMLVASISACFQGNIKRLLAFSSVAQIAYIVLGSALGSEAGLTAAGLHMFNHALAKGGLFLALCLLALRSDSLELDALRGAGRAMPMVAGALTICALSLVGVPGTAGFISKWYLLGAAFAAGPWGIAVAVAILLSSLLSVVYVWKILEQLWFGEPDPALRCGTEQVDMQWLSLWIVAAANVYFGLVPSIPMELATSGARTLLGVGS